MLRLFTNRLLQTVVVVFIVSLIVFALMRLVPGDPIQLIYGDEALSESQRAIISAELGLDQPIIAQYFAFLFGLVRGDLGQSLFFNTPVTELIAPAFMATIELTLAAVIVATVIGLPIAVICAIKQGTAIDRAGSAIALFGISMPSFWLGILLVLIFSVSLGWFPTGGQIGVELETITGLKVLDSILTGNMPALGSALSHLVLPAVTLGLAVAATLVRVLRSGLIEVKQEGYIEALQARGASQRTVLRHMLRNALPATAIMMGIRIGSLLGGAIVIEVIFSWPGIGRLIVDAIGQRDYPLVQGGVIIMAILFVAVNFAVDILHGVLDPRIRQTQKVG